MQQKQNKCHYTQTHTHSLVKEQGQAGRGGGTRGEKKEKRKKKVAASQMPVCLSQCQLPQIG